MDDEDGELVIELETTAPPVLTIHLPMSASKFAAIGVAVEELWPGAFVYPGDDDTELLVIPKE